MRVKKHHLFYWIIISIYARSVAAQEQILIPHNSNHPYKLMNQSHVAINNSGDQIAFSSENIISIYDYPSMHLVTSWDTPSWLSDIAFSKNGEYVWSFHDREKYTLVRNSSPRDSTRIWHLNGDGQRPKLVNRFVSQLGFVSSTDTTDVWSVFHFSEFAKEPTYNTEYCSGSYLMKYKKDQQVGQLRLPSCAVSEVASVDQEIFVIGHKDGRITAWNTGDLSLKWEQQIGEYPVRIHSLIKDSLIAVSHGYRYESGTAYIEIRDINDGSLVGKKMSPQDWDYTTEARIINSIAYNEINDQLVVLYDDFNLAIVELASGKALRTGGKIYGLQRLHDVAIDPQGKILVAGSPRASDNKPAILVALDADKERLADLRYFENDPLLKSDTSSTIYTMVQYGHSGRSSIGKAKIVGCTNDGQFLVSHSDNKILVWDANNLKLIKRFQFKGNIKVIELTETGFLTIVEISASPFIIKYNFEKKSINKLAVQNQHMYLSYERVWENEVGDYYLYEHNESAFYLTKIDGNTGKIVKKIFLDSRENHSASAFYHHDKIFLTSKQKLHVFDIKSETFQDLGINTLSFVADNGRLLLVTPSGLKEYNLAKSSVIKTWKGIIPSKAEYYRVNPKEQAMLIGLDGSIEYLRWDEQKITKKNEWEDSYNLKIPYPLPKNRIVWSVNKTPVVSNALVEMPPEENTTVASKVLDLYNDRLITKNAVYSLSEANLVDSYNGGHAYFINKDSIVYVANEPESDSTYGTLHHYFIHKNLKTQEKSRVILRKQPKISLDMIAYNRQTGIAVTTSFFDKELQLWDTKTGKEIAKFDKISFATYQQVSFDKTGSRILVSVMNNLQPEIWTSSYPFKKFMKITDKYSLGVYTNHPDSIALDWVMQHTDTKQNRNTYSHSSARETSRVFAFEKNRLITGYSGGGISVWNPEDENYQWSTYVHSADITKMVADGCILASLSEDDHYAIHNICEEKTLINLYPSVNAPLVADNANLSSVWITPDNYYKATKNTTDLVHFVKDDKAYAFDQFDLYYNRPDLVLSAIGFSDTTLMHFYKNAFDKRLEKMDVKLETIDLEAMENSQTPEILLSDNQSFMQTDKPEISISVGYLAPEGVSVDKIMVYVNDIPIFGVEGYSVSNDERENISIQLSPGVNKIGFSALASNNLYSLKEEITVEYLTSVRKKQSLHLITVGVSDYKYLNKLKYAVTDAEEISTYFKQRKDLFDTVTHYELLDESATKEQILQLRDSLAQSHIDDLVIIFMAGHGVISQDLEWRYATYNYPPSQMSEKGLTFEQIEKLVDGIPARNRLILIDACHSGELDADDLRAAQSDQVKSGAVVFRTTSANPTSTISKTHVGLENSFQLMGRLFNDLRRSSGAVVISAAGGAEYAWESDDWQNGVFTYALLDGLRYRKADIDDDGQIMVSELKKFIENRVQELTQGGQRPTSRQENLIYDFQILSKQ